MKYDTKLADIVHTAVTLSQVGDNVMTTLDAIEKRLRKGGVTAEVWLDEPIVIYNERSWAIGFARFDGRYRLAVREVFESKEPGYAMPLKHGPRLLRLRAATAVGTLLERLHEMLQAQMEEAEAAAAAAEKALGDVARLVDEAVDDDQDEEEGAQDDEEEEDDDDAEEED